MASDKKITELPETNTLGDSDLLTTVQSSANKKISGSNIKSQIAGTKLEKALTDSYIFVGNGSNQAAGVPVSGEASVSNTGAVTLSNSAVIGKSLTGYTAGLGTISATDSLLSGMQKADGNLLSDRTITKEPTGFTNSNNVTVNYDSSARTITLTGTFVAYYRGNIVTELTNGWISAAHSVTTDKKYFLAYTGATFQWLDLSVDTLDVSYLLIAFVNYGITDKFANRECHGLMNWETHKELHYTIGTYRESGGTLGDYTLNSTTAANRRPSVSACLLFDEDLGTINATLTAGGNYTQFYLSSTDTVNFNTTATDIIPLSTNQPYYNQFTGGAWQQTLMSNNNYSAIWVIAMPVTTDSDSQKYRYFFVQGQSQSATLDTIQALTPSQINLGQLSNLAPEFVYIAKIILRYTAANWILVEVNNLTGTKLSQGIITTGNYLSSVTTDSTLTGIGTAGSPLGINLSNENNWLANQTFTENVTIQKNLYVNGTEVINEVQSLAIEDNTIFINKGETGTGITKGYAGLDIDRGTGNQYSILYNEAQDNFRCGEFWLTLNYSTLIGTFQLHEKIQGRVSGAIGYIFSDTGSVLKIKGTYGSFLLGEHIDGKTSLADAIISAPQTITDNTQAVATREDTPQNNGISFWNSSTYKLETSANLYWDRTNSRLGLGTISPGYLLHVAGDINYTGDLRLSGNIVKPWATNGSDIYYSNKVAIGANNYDSSGCKLTLNGTSTYDCGIGFNHSSTRTFMMYSNPSFKIHQITGPTHVVFEINSSSGSTTIYDASSVALLVCDAANNRVGINTTAPDKQLEINSSTGACLRLTYSDANGSAVNRTDFAISSGGALTITPTAGANINLALATTGDFAVNTNDLYVDTSTGYVGVNTTNPLKQFQVVTATNQQGLSHTDGTYEFATYIGGGLGAVYIGSVSNHDLGFYTNDSTALAMLKTTGKFGFRSTNPDKQVEINNAIGECLRLTYDASAGGATNYTDFDVSSGGNLTIKPSGGSLTLTIKDDTSQVGLKISNSDGSISIINNTATANAFQPSIIMTAGGGAGLTNLYAGAITSGNDSGTTPITLFRSYLSSGAVATTRPLYAWQNYTTTYMTMLVDGKLGLGVTDPSSKLDVAGDIEIGSANNYFLGAPTTDGTWKFVRSGNDLLIQRRESGAYVTKTTITA